MLHAELNPKQTGLEANFCRRNALSKSILVRTLTPISKHLKHHASAADAQLSITPICSFSDVEAADVIDFSDEKRTDKLTDDSVDNVEMKKIRDAAIHHDGQESHLLKQFLK